jgi:hypothetical protein
VSSSTDSRALSFLFLGQENQNENDLMNGKQKEQESTGTVPGIGSLRVIVCVNRVRIPAFAMSLLAGATTDN